MLTNSDTIVTSRQHSQARNPCLPPTRRWDGSTATHAPGTNNGPWQTIQRGQQGMRAELVTPGGLGTLTLTLASGIYELDSTLALGAADSPQAAAAGYSNVVWQGPGFNTPPCRANRMPGNFSAACDEPTADEAAVVSAGSTITWTVATVEQAKAVAAEMDPTAPAAGPNGLVAAQATGTLYVGTWNGSAAAGDVSPPSQIYDAAGHPRVRARWPQPGQYAVWEAPLCNESLHVTSPCATRARYGFQYAAGTVLPTYSSRAATRFQVYHGWTASAHALSQVLPGNRTVLFQNPSDRPIGYWPNHDSEGGGRFFIEAAEYLTTASPGQWAWSAAVGGALYVARSGEDPVRAPLWSASRLQVAVNRERVPWVVDLLAAVLGNRAGYDTKCCVVG